MKRPGAYIIVGLLFLIAFSEVGWAAGNYNISPATVPPSMRREGLVRSPGAFGGTGNLLITGNIRGPAYFRGIVPYSGPTDFGVTLPSSSLDPFLRDSAGMEDFSSTTRYPSSVPLYRPYYSPTQTAASALPGAYTRQVGVPAASMDAYTAQSYISGTLPTRRDETLDTTSALSLARWRPMSMTPEQMQKLISFEITKNSPGGPTGQQYQEHAEQYKSYSPEGYYKTGEFNEPQLGMASSLLPYTPNKLGVEVNQPFGIPTGETNEMQFGVRWAVDINKPPFVYDQMKQQIDDLQKKLDLELITPKTEKTAEEGNKPSGEQTREKSQAEKLAGAASSVAGAKAILGPYETFASFSQDKFNQTMRVAEIYLKQGKYYRAADAYTLASLYKPNDPLAYAGKSHALFASGEYMSSALFLSRALQIFPEYAEFKIDLVAMVGSRDQLESRVADVKEWLDRSDAPELQFLLAYVYYQMDRPVQAKEAIDAASEKMPQSPPVLTLKKAIEEAPAAEDKAGSSLRITDPATGKTVTVTGDASKK